MWNKSLKLILGVCDKHTKWSNLPVIIGLLVGSALCYIISYLVK